MKKRVAAMLLLACSLTITGCSGGSKETKNQETGDTSKVSTDTGTEESEDNRPQYTALDYVTLGEYKGLEVTLISLEPTEEEINDRIETELTQKNRLTEVTEGTVGETGTVNIDYVGTVDGEDLENGTDKNVDIRLEETNIIPGFEEAFGASVGQAMAEKLKGAGIGSEVSVNVAFPETYETDESLSGKEAVFQVTVNSVKTVPELTDELAGELSEGRTAAEYREQIRKTLEEEKAAARESQKVNDLFAQIYSTSTIQDYPQDVITYSIDTLVGYYETYAGEAGQTFEEFLQQNFGQSEEEFRNECMEMVKESLSQEMILMAIAETEDLTVSEGEYAEGLENYAESAGAGSTEEYLKTTTKAEVLRNLLLDKALAVVEDSAVIHDPQETDSKGME